MADFPALQPAFTIQVSPSLTRGFRDVTSTIANDAKHLDIK